MAMVKYEEKYSERAFWKKVRKYALKIGKAGLERALRLYYASQDPKVPPWARATVYGALGYFIWPLDAIADIAPGLGFTDDIGVMASALAIISSHITPKIRKKAAKKVSEWFD